MSRWKQKAHAPTLYAFTCEILVAPYSLAPGPAFNGGRRWTWPGLDAVTATQVECGYRCHTEEQLLCHLVATHRIPAAANARKVAGVA